MGDQMELKQAMQNRKSCRKYTEQPVEREKLTAIVDAARLAPSGSNLQRWKFIIVDDAEKKKQLSEALAFPEFRLNTFTRAAPAFIVIVKQEVELPEASVNIMDKHANCIWDNDIGIAAAYICLAATDMGLGSVMLGRFRQGMIRETLHIPEKTNIGLIVSIGYPLDPSVKPKNRRDLSDIMCINDYNN